MPKDYYNILGVSRSATAEEVKRAYRKLAHEHHPDKGGSEEKFKEINEAYQILSDPEKKQQYDQFGSTDGAGFGGAGGPGFNPFGQGFNVRYEDLGGIGDIFSQFFGAEAPFGARAQTGGRERRVGDDVELELAISFNEMVFGVKKEVSLNRFRTCDRCKGNLAEPGTKIETCETCSGTGVVERQMRTVLGSFVQRTICPDCRGEGKRASVPCKECRGEGRTQTRETLIVTIPPGLETGTRLRMTGEGEAPLYGGDPGDLYIRLRVQEHKAFQRSGNHILSSVSVPFVTAALGGEVPIETVDGKDTLSIPRGTSSGAEVTLKGKGVVIGKSAESSKRGDHRFTVVVDVPKKVTKQQEELLRKFEELNEKKKGFRLFS